MWAMQAQKSHTTHIPLDEPDVRISRIRLSCNLHLRHSQINILSTWPFDTGYVASGRISPAFKFLHRFFRSRTFWIIQAVLPPLTKTLITAEVPSLHGRYPASSLLWPHPTSDSGPGVGYGFPTSSWPDGLPIGPPKFLLSLSTRAVSYHPGEQDGCAWLLLHRPFQVSSNLENWPLPNSVTRPKRVRLCYGSRLRLTNTSPAQITPDPR